LVDEVTHNLCCKKKNTSDVLLSKRYLHYSKLHLHRRYASSSSFKSFSSSIEELTQLTTEITDDLFEFMVQKVKEADPENILINTDQNWSWADGLHSGQRELVLHYLGTSLSQLNIQFQIKETIQID
jgi:hypothetical protein